MKQKQTKIIMGMPITIEIVDDVSPSIITDIFEYFRQVDRKYSTYKPNSEISRINNGLPREQWSAEVKATLRLGDQTKRATHGYFDIKHNGKLDPSGLVKGWAIANAARQLLKVGVRNFYIDAGGDIQTHGHNAENKPWTIGIRNPFKREEIIKTLNILSGAVATSGTYVRGQHIYDPFQQSGELIDELKSLTVVGPDIYDADRFATAAFAMGTKGINFIESIEGLEGYMVDNHQIATFTSGFERYVTTNA